MGLETNNMYSNRSTVAVYFKYIYIYTQDCLTVCGLHGYTSVYFFFDLSIQYVVAIKK